MRQINQMNRQVLVTGGGGFLGRYIVEQLRERGDAVTVFARGNYPELAQIGATVARGDLRDAQAIAAACAGMDAVFHVAARPGQIVCRINALVSVDGRPVVVARQRDGRGRPLPVWQGCRTLRVGELLMLNPDHADSMDGRYFGSLPASAVLGRAIPILTRDTPDAPLVWR